MNSAEYVDQQIQEMKNGGVPLSEAAWKAALLCVGWAYVFGARGQYCTPANRRSRYNGTSPGKDRDNIKNKCQNFEGSGSCSGCKWYPNGKRTRFFDCRGFTYWILLAVFEWKLMGAGCTSQWNNEDNWKAKGEVADGIPQDVIVCLFYYKKDKQGKRTKTLEHTGLYYNGETIECSNGVEYSKTLNKKWDVWGVPACVKGYTPGPTPPGPTPPGPEPVKKPTIRKGDRGPYVKECQEDLLALGYDVGKTGADGIFGKNTEAAVKKFQKEHKDRDGKPLKVDGIVGQKTWGALDDAVGEIGAQDVPAL